MLLVSEIQLVSVTKSQGSCEWWLLSNPLPSRKGALACLGPQISRAFFLLPSSTNFVDDHPLCLGTTKIVPQVSPARFHHGSSRTIHGQPKIYISERHGPQCTTVRRTLILRSVKLSAYRKMIQTSILRYITSDRQHLTASNSSSFFLRLPYNIRKRIYEYAGLFRGEHISLNYQRPEWMDDSFHPIHCLDALAPPDDYEEEEDLEVSEYSQHLTRFLDGPMPNPNIRLQRAELYCCSEYNEDGPCDCDYDPPLLPSQLLDVCRAVSREVEHLFLSKNHFSVDSSCVGGLSGLSSLTPRAMASLSSLTINLDIDNCFYQGSVVQWEKLCQTLAAAITPHHLALAIVCDGADIRTAKQIVKPMLQLPILESCAISFSTKPGISSISELRELARHIVLKLTGQSLAAPFRFLDLPRELQLKILMYTDLVTTYDIAWCPDMSQHRESSGALHARSIVWVPWAPNSYMINCCEQCTPVGTMCCCSTKHTACSTTTCTCWIMPISLLLVSRGV